MNIPTIIIGITALLFGIYTIYVRKTNPGKFAKIKAMQENFGEKRGVLIHWLFYSVVPILFGISMIFAGIMGVSFI